MGEVEVHLLGPLAQAIVASGRLVRGTDELFGEETHRDEEVDSRDGRERENGDLQSEDVGKQVKKEMEI